LRRCSWSWMCSHFNIGGRQPGPSQPRHSHSISHCRYRTWLRGPETARRPSRGGRDSSRHTGLRRAVVSRRRKDRSAPAVNAKRGPRRTRLWRCNHDGTFRWAAAGDVSAASGPGEGGLCGERRVCSSPWATSSRRDAGSCWRSRRANCGLSWRYACQPSRSAFERAGDCIGGWTSCSFIGFATAS
jgi:hypothetical protein